jgi:hypothetical protein
MMAAQPQMSVSPAGPGFKLVRVSGAAPAIRAWVRRRWAAVATAATVTVTESWTAIMIISESVIMMCQGPAPGPRRPRETDSEHTASDSDRRRAARDSLGTWNPSHITLRAGPGVAAECQ